MKIKDERFWEIDFFRGFAVLLMIIFHFVFDVYYMLRIRLIASDYFWLLFPRIIASIFILIFGICLYISYSRKISSNKIVRIGIFQKYLKRGIKLFLLGMVITFITILFIKEGYIIFGILHFLGFSSIIAYPFLRFKKLNLILGAISIGIGFIISKFHINSHLLLFLGIFPRNFFSLDYFPIFPWFGFVLIGIFFGKILYNNGKRSFKLKDFSYIPLIKFFCFLGRNSLKIYFLHQPIIIFIIFAFFK